MLGALNLYETKNGYDNKEGTLLCEGATKINLEVSGAGIFVRMATRARNRANPGSPLANFGPEAYKGPNTYLLVRNCDAVQVRSAVAGKPAIVNIEALGPDD